MDKKDKVIAKAKSEGKTSKYLLDVLMDVMENVGSRCQVCEMEGITSQPEWNATVITDKQLEEFLEKNEYKY